MLEGRAGPQVVHRDHCVEMLAQNVALDLAILDLRLADGSSPKSNVEQLRSAGLETLIFTETVPRSTPVPRHYWVLYLSQTDCRRG